MKLPKGWEIVRLQDMVSYVKGKKPRILSNVYKEGLVPYIDIKAFEKGKIRQYADVESSKLLKKDDILVVWDGARSGLVGIGRTGAIGSTIASLTPRNVNSKYLFYYLQTKYEFLNSNPRGTGIPHIDPNLFWNIEIPLAPLNEQRRIVAKLEKLLAKVDSCNERLEKIPAILKQFRQSVLAAACSGRLTEDWRKKNPVEESVENILKNIQEKRIKQALTSTQKSNIKNIYSYREQGDPSELPEGWRYVTLDKLCESFQYGTSSKSMKTGKIPVLRMGNLQNGEIDWNDLVYTSNEKEIEKYKLQPGDVLFNRTNSPELVGKTSIYRGERPAIFAGYLIRIKSYKELNPEYLNIYLNSIYAKEHCLMVKTDGVSQSNINAQKLGKFEIPFCAIAEQNEIFRRVEALFKIADQIEERYKKAKTYVERLTQAILAKAFRGELVPQDPNDEPASVLLERIRQEKAKLEKEKK